jgi:hydrogenase-4 membrane subunit HyfE
MNTALLFQIQSALILLLLFVGVYFKRERIRHVRIMTSAIIWDILLVLQIELNRGAIAKAVQVTENKWILNLHVTLAVSSVIFYFVMIYTGRKLLNFDNSIRPKHKLFGMMTLTLRILTFITSFFIK